MAELLLPGPAPRVAEARVGWPTEGLRLLAALHGLGARGPAPLQPLQPLRPAAAEWPVPGLAATVTAGAAALAAGLVAGARRRLRAPWRGALGVPRRERCIVHLRAAKGGRPGRGRKGRKGGRGGGPVVAEVEPEEDFLILSEDGLTVNELAQKLRRPAAGIITFFFAERGTPLSLNDVLNRELCMDVAQHYGVEVLFEEEEVTSAARERGFLAEEHVDAQPRPPVVTVMGHVDHGKTTLLDTMRKRSVAATEAGGITQRIGAYTVEVGSQKATFIDTPGHEAFTSMRARGAQVTDIAVLVVAATDGVMPQTREAIAHARAAEVPIIVAINKIDMPSAAPDQTRQALSEEGLICEEWGGEIPMVECSAKKNINIDGLLEVITLTAEVGELTARHSGPAAGVVLESTFEPHRGALATLLVQRGTLHVGDCAVAGSKFCRVKALKDEAGKDLSAVGPSIAAQVNGFTEAPLAGEQFEVYSSVQEAREVAERRERAEKDAGPVGFEGRAVGDDSEAIRLALILKTDAQGSVAAVKYMFDSMKDSKYINLRWLLAAPGPITDTDVELAATCPKDQRAMIVGFNTTVSSSALRIAKEKGVDVQTFKVIYELFETVVKRLQNEIGEEEKLTEKGRSKVLAVFDGRFGKVAGSRVTEGQLIKGNRVKVYRQKELVGQGKIVSLREGKEDVGQVDEENECGFSIEGFEGWQPGDEAICYEVNMVTPELVKKRKQEATTKASAGQR